MENKTEIHDIIFVSDKYGRNTEGSNEKVRIKEELDKFLNEFLWS